MKLARLALDDGPTLVAAADEGGVPVAVALGGEDPDVNVIEILADDGALQRLRSALEESPDRALRVTEDARTLRPFRRVKRVLAIGVNYRDHAAEVGIDLPQAPLLFARWESSLTAPYADVVVPGDVVCQFDHEVELAAVVAQPLYRATAEEAAKAIGGWTVANDLSARDLQFSDGQWTRGKNIDGSCPVGPVVVPRGELDPAALGIRCWVDDELRQNSSTAQLLFTTSEVLAHLSRTMRIGPGDLVLTETPAGVALGSPAPRWLQDGQLVRCEIDGIGATANQIRFVPEPRNE